MKILSIKHFKAPKGSKPADHGIVVPQDGQLVRIKDKLVQFVVPPAGAENCINCYFNDEACSRVTCGNGHFAPISTPTDIFTAPKEQV